MYKFSSFVPWKRGPNTVCGVSHGMDPTTKYAALIIRHLAITFLCWLFSILSLLHLFLPDLLPSILQNKVPGSDFLKTRLRHMKKSSWYKVI